MAGLYQQPSQARLTNYLIVTAYNKSCLIAVVCNEIKMTNRSLSFLFLQSWYGFITQHVFCHVCRDERGQKHLTARFPKNSYSLGLVLSLRKCSSWNCNVKLIQKKATELSLL